MITESHSTYQHSHQINLRSLILRTTGLRQLSLARVSEVNPASTATTLRCIPTSVYRKYSLKISLYLDFDISRDCAGSLYLVDPNFHGIYSLITDERVWCIQSVVSKVRAFSDVKGILFGPSLSKYTSTRSSF